jgi:acetate kinase
LIKGDIKLKVFVLNCGSSSLKYQLIDMSTDLVLAKGLCERIGIDGSNIAHEPDGKEKVKMETPMKDHTDAVQLVIDSCLHAEYGVIKSIDEIGAVGHRVVHGGEKFAKSAIITDEVKNAIKDCCALAPLHNPANLIGIDACEKLMPKVKQVAVFDTAFHQTMEKDSYLYALPYELYEKYAIRRYGFHGTSHLYVSDRASSMLGKPLSELKIVTCHLGNGASVCAVKNGKSVDTSMGLTPLEGLAMGTRSGDMDPAIVKFVMDKEGLSIADVDNMLNKKSGVLGVSGVSSDFRDIMGEAEKGNDRAKYALALYARRVAKYIGAYAAAMNGIDAVVFTAGLGENSGDMRKDVCAYLEWLGVKLNVDANSQRGKEIEITTADSKVKVLVIPTNEELVIARDTMALVK